MTINNPQLDLTMQLKKLGLTGMLEALAIRNKEAIANQMSFCEFLMLLAQDELLAKENRRYQRRQRAAGFKGSKTIENYDFDFNPRINQTLIKDLATCRFIKEKSPVIIVGPCGTGKSHLAQALGQCAIQQGYGVLYTTQAKISAELQASKATNQYMKKIKSFNKIPLIIIDDFALKPMRWNEEEDFHDLVAERYEQASLLVTSNLAVAEWEQAFTNKLLASATIDRLIQDSYQLILDGKSYRSAKVGADYSVSNEKNEAVVDA